MNAFTERYQHTNGTTATLLFAPTERGFVVNVTGWNPFRVRFLKLDAAQTTCGVVRLRLRCAGFERVEEKAAA